MTIVTALSRRVVRAGAFRSGWAVVGRSFATKTKEIDYPVASRHTLDVIKPPESYAPSDEDIPEDPNVYIRSAVTSAHMIEAGKLSTKDSAVISPSGTIVHGRYGDLGKIRGVPLEYLALLHPAAEAAAAIRQLPATGTVLIYGASEAAGLSAVQLAAGAGFGVVAVVGRNHNGDDEMMAAVKGMAGHVGAAVPEEFALLKKNFANLVEGTATGVEPEESVSDSQMLEEFKANVVDYAIAYPSTRPAAVSSSALDFVGKDKDREHFRENMEAYLEQFPGGSPPISAEQLAEGFSMNDYMAFREKFNAQTTGVITGDDVGRFNPAEIVYKMMTSGETSPDVDEDMAQVEFSLTRDDITAVGGVGKGGDVVGAIIVVNPELKEAAEAVAAAGPSLREKAEALKFLHPKFRNAYCAATAVVTESTKRGGSVQVVGGELPGFETVQPSDEDVKKVLEAMTEPEDSPTALNFFIEAYRANDFPVYASYAAFRSTEPLAGPRQYIVTK